MSADVTEEADEFAAAGRLSRRPLDDFPGMLIDLGTPRLIDPPELSSPLCEVPTGECLSRSSEATFSTLLLEGIKILPNSFAPLTILVRRFEIDGNLE